MAVASLLRPFGQVFPDFFLLLVIVADGERHEAVERHFALAVERNQLRADTRQLEPLPHHLNGHAEPRGDILVAHLLIGQRLEGVELVGGMHGLADFVFGKADLCRVFHIERVAGHEKIRARFSCAWHAASAPQAAATGATSTALQNACAGGFRLQILQQAVSFDAGGELLDAAQPVGLAHIVRRGNKLR